MDCRYTVTSSRIRNGVLAMLTIKMLAVASALVVGSAAITTTLFINGPVAAAPDNSCAAVLAELQAAKEKVKVQDEAFKKWVAGTPQSPHGSGKGF